MTLSTWIRRCFSRQSRSRLPMVRRRKPKVRPSVRPVLEVLEDRLAPAVLTVNTLADAVTDTTHLDLREALTLVNNGGNPGSLNQASMPSGWASHISGVFGSNDTIQFDPNLLTQNAGFGVGVIGPSAGPGITIERPSTAPGINVPNMRLFYVGASGDLTLDNLTLQGGIALGGNGAGDGGGGAGLGGAIFNQGNLNIQNSLLTGNTARGGAGYTGFGGGGMGGNGTPGYGRGTLNPPYQGGYGGGPNAGNPNGGPDYSHGSYLGINGGFGGGGSAGPIAGKGGFGGGGGGGAYIRPSGNFANGGDGGFGGGGGGGRVSNGNGMAGVSEFGGGEGTTVAVGVIGSSCNGGGGAGFGGAIFNDQTSVVITNTTITGNLAAAGPSPGHAGMGAGIFNYDGNVTVNYSTLVGNYAAQGGAEIYNLADGDLDLGDTAVLTLNDSVLANSQGSSEDVHSATINGGTAGQGVGGAIFNYQGFLVITNSTIADNTAQHGGGIYDDEFQEVATPFVSLTNSIVANSSGGGDFERSNTAGPESVGSNNLIGHNAGFEGGVVSNANPLLGPLQNNGGPTPTLALLPGSPAIDAGDSAVSGLPTTDQRGFARIIGKAIDIGAVEYQYDLAVSGSAPSTVQAGQIITYQITVTNNGPDTAGNGGGVVLTDVLPSGVGFQSIAAPSGWSASNQGRTITVTIPTLDAGVSATFTLVVQTSNSTPNSVSNTLTIGPSTWDTNTNNNSVTFTTSVTPAATNISNEVLVTRSGFRYDFAHHEFVQTVTITNTIATTLFGPLALQLTGLSSNATLANASGTYNGDPYIDFLSASQSLAAGQSITVTLYFKDPTFQSITYGTEVLQGI